MSSDERLSVAGGIALVILMLGTAWYGVVEPPRSAEGPGSQTSATAWGELHTLRWVLVAAVAAALVAPIIRRLAGRAGDTAAGVAAAIAATLGGLASLALFARVLVDPPNPASVDDIKVGAYLALLAALAIAIGAANRTRRWWRTGPAGTLEAA